jgi:hypothetical protein
VFGLLERFCLDIILVRQLVLLPTQLFPRNNLNLKTS